MKLRKNRILYYFYSILIHVLILVLYAQFIHVDTADYQFEDTYIVDLFTIPRPIIVKPPEPVSPLLPPEQIVPDNLITNEKPSVPKPTVNLNADWQTLNDSVITTNEAPRKQQFNSLQDTKTTHSKNKSQSNNHILPNHTNIHSNLKPIDHGPFEHSTEHSTQTSTTNEVIKGDIQHISLDTNNNLNDLSLSVGTPKVHYGSRRGDALRATGMGNSWGGGSTSSSDRSGGIYIKMMKEIGDDLSDATTTEKVDIVFIIDETASMVDNIRGIRAYFEFIFDAFRRNGHDVSFGLVTFTDKTKVYGQTNDIGTFKNWLFKIDVDHGGDISESGLDALMTGIKDIKFRKNTQRFFILASDAAFHDADYDGRSTYSLDQVIETLQKEMIRVEVIGLDYLPIKQIAMATGGKWRGIPGKGYLEYVPPLTLTEKMLSKLGTLDIDGSALGDKITVYVNNPPRPNRMKLTWKILNPIGERCHGPIIEHKDIPDNNIEEIEFTPVLNSQEFQSIPGIYTVIYLLENDNGHRSILRRTLNYQ
ncbi:VWA domain-containing protein [Candidatus Poribacteria bacterium]|nr:VWA domain-containing protein [Candidatus Poribacteria bacterium]